jgi:hypothetical protein
MSLTLSFLRGGASCMAVRPRFRALLISYNHPSVYISIRNPGVRTDEPASIPVPVLGALWLIASCIHPTVPLLCVAFVIPKTRSTRSEAVAPLQPSSALHLHPYVPLPYLQSCPTRIIYILTLSRWDNLGRPLPVERCG